MRKAATTRLRHESAAATSQLFGPQLEPHWQRSTYGFLARRRSAPYAWMIALLNLTGALLRWAKVALLSAMGPEDYSELRRTHGRWAVVHLRALRRRSTLDALR